MITIQHPADDLAERSPPRPDGSAGGRAASAAFRVLLARVPGRPAPAPRALEIEAALLRAATPA